MKILFLVESLIINRHSSAIVSSNTIFPISKQYDTTVISPDKLTQIQSNPDPYWIRMSIIYELNIRIFQRL